jgi:hypothetical protein
MLDALGFYKFEEKGKAFAFLHCFKKIQGCKGGTTSGSPSTRRKMTGEGGPVTLPTASMGHPIDNKKEKAERSGARALAAIDTSIEKMVPSFTAKIKAMGERNATVWKALLDKQDIKIGLEREKVESAKMEAQVVMVFTMNEASNIALAKMTQLEFQVGWDFPSVPCPIPSP